MLGSRAALNRELTPMDANDGQPDFPNKLHACRISKLVGRPIWCVPRRCLSANSSRSFAFIRGSMLGSRAALHRELTPMDANDGQADVPNKLHACRISEPGKGQSGASHGGACCELFAFIRVHSRFNASDPGTHFTANRR